MVQDSRSGTSGLDVGGSALGWNGRETALFVLLLLLLLLLRRWILY